MTTCFIQDDENKIQEKAHPEKEKYRSTLWHFPNEKDKTVVNYYKLCTMRIYKIEY